MLNTLDCTLTFPAQGSCGSPRSCRRSVLSVTFPGVSRALSTVVALRSRSSFWVFGSGLVCGFLLVFCALRAFGLRLIPDPGLQFPVDLSPRPLRRAHRLFRLLA